MTRPTPIRKLSQHGTTVTFWLPAGVLQRIEREARREGMSRSRFIAAIVSRSLDAERPAVAPAA